MQAARIGRSTALRIAVAVLAAVLFMQVGGLGASGEQHPSLPPQAEGGPSSLTAPGRSSDADWEALEAKVSEGGTVRVLVGLDVPTIPEGKLNALDKQAQRTKIKGAQEAVITAASTHKTTKVRRTMTTLPFVSLEVSEPGLRALRSSPHVRTVREVGTNSIATEQSIPLVGADTLATRGMDGDTSSGSNTVVAVLDTGVESSHPMLSGKVVEEACFASDCQVPGSYYGLTGPGAGQPCTLASVCGHGTHVAAIAAGRSVTLDSVPAVGVARGADIMSVRVFGPDGKGGITNYQDDLVAALDHVADVSQRLPIAAVNMSLGDELHFEGPCGGVDPALDAAIGNLMSLNIAPVASSGNKAQVTDGWWDPTAEYEDGIGSPACVPYVISVGSTTKTDAVNTSSQAAWNLSLLAPGTGIVSAELGGVLRSKDGTSMAAPHVAGVFAIAKEVDPNVRFEVVRDALRDTGVSIVDSRSGQNRTFKRIRACAAIAKMIQTTRPASYDPSLCQVGPTQYVPGQAPATVKYTVPNHSLAFIRDGLVATGVLKNGVWTQKSTFATGAWTHAAVSRDTLLLYNTNTGDAETGWFSDGTYERRERYNLGAGWTHLTASCDSYLLYRQGTSYGQSGALQSGKLDVRRSYTTFSNNWQLISASCDTIQFEFAEYRRATVRAWGYLVNGVFEQKGSWSSSNYGFPFSHLVHTKDSYVIYSRSHSYGDWGTARYGVRSNPTGNASGFSPWDVLAGTGDTVLFYNRSNGVGAMSTVVGGVYTYRGAVGFSSGWQLIAGGK